MRYLKRQSIFMLVGLFLVFGALVSGVAHAQVGGGNPLDDIEITIATEIIIPGSETTFVDGFLRGKVGDLANYLSIVYNFLISIVGVVAGVFILVGGFQYLTAGGDAARVSSAKNRIANALIGMVLALSSFVLLNTINPELVNLELPSELKRKVTTQLAYLPYCDDLVKQNNVSINDVTIASGSKRCGSAGFLQKGTTINEAGETQSGRLWCIFRGNQGEDEGLAGGCKYDKRRTLEALSNDSAFLPQVCMINPGVTAAELDSEYDKNGKVGSKGFCTACWGLNNQNTNVLGPFDGDTGGACQAWMNIANNGSASDFNFSLEHKKEVGFTLEAPGAAHASGSPENKVYYCGLSDAGDKCVNVEIKCDEPKTTLDECEEYGDANKTEIYFCEDADSTKCYDEELDSFTGGTFGLHLGRVCRANPCGAKGKCGAGAITDTLQTAGISTGGGLHTLKKGVAVLPGIAAEFCE